jgi:hypothetical protein
MKTANLINQSCRKTLVGLSALALLLVGCAKSTTYSLLADENTFSQNSSKISGKMDILWVIDNSGSMDSSQQAIIDNFQRFVEKFKDKGFDFRMAVTTTDSYKALFAANNASYTGYDKFRDGNDVEKNYSGYFVIDPSVPDWESKILVNLKQGIWGSGDERAFQSMKVALNSPLNTGFLRPDAFLSVIIVSDEDDFSWNGSGSKAGQYTYSGLHTVQSYVDFLDSITGATAANRSQKYNVNSIAVLDETCRQALDSKITGRRIGQRYIELSNLTGGIKGSLCDDFGTTLADISTKLIELATTFYLNRVPNPDSIVVIVNGAQVSSDPVNGYQYDATANSISFHGTAIPGPGAAISVAFDPLSLK